METLRQWFDDFTRATGEKVEQIIFGPTYPGDAEPRWAAVERMALLTFDDLPTSVLDVEFDDGYGGTESPDLCAWSASWVVFSDQYDGAESLRWVPRHPTAHEPIRPGGG